MSIDSQKYIQFINSRKFDASSTFQTSKAQSYEHSTSALNGLITKKQTTGRDGIARHHLQFIRLRTGYWFKWKNIPLLSIVVDDFQKQLKLQQASEEEEETHLT